MTSFFWVHYYAFLAAFSLLLLATATVALLRGWIEQRGEFVAIILELVVIVMIGVELKEGHDQDAVLEALNTSANATVSALQQLQSMQKDSATTLAQMNESTREQANTVKSMNGVLQQQLAILSGEQRARIEQANLHPSLELKVMQNGGGPKLVSLVPNSATVASVDPTPYMVTGSGADRVLRNATGFVMHNVGNTALRRPRITARVGLPNRFRCLEIMSLNLSVQTKRADCDPGGSAVETIPDIPADSGLTFRVVYDEDPDTKYFEAEVTVSADNFPTTRYEVQEQYKGRYP